MKRDRSDGIASDVAPEEVSATVEVSIAKFSAIRFSTEHSAWISSDGNRLTPFLA